MLRIIPLCVKSLQPWQGPETMVEMNKRIYLRQTAELPAAAHKFRTGDNVAMQQIWFALIGGLILGWLIEWLIDWWFWRRSVTQLRQENQQLRRQLEEARRRLDGEGK